MHTDRDIPKEPIVIENPYDDMENQDDYGLKNAMKCYSTRNQRNDESKSKSSHRRKSYHPGKTKGSDSKNSKIEKRESGRQSGSHNVKMSSVDNLNIMHFDKARTSGITVYKENFKKIERLNRESGIMDSARKSKIGDSDYSEIKERKRTKHVSYGDAKELVRMDSNLSLGNIDDDPGTSQDENEVEEDITLMRNTFGDSISPDINFCNKNQFDSSIEDSPNIPKISKFNELDRFNTVGPLTSPQGIQKFTFDVAESDNEFKRKIPKSSIHNDASFAKRKSRLKN